MSSGIECGVVLFESTSAALKAEKEAVKTGLKVKLIPVPRALNSGCGFCLRFDWQDIEKIRGLLISRELKFEGIHKLKWPPN
jgi:hypothetical protein